jgi:hypothetical protein
LALAKLAWEFDLPAIRVALAHAGATALLILVPMAAVIGLEAESWLFLLATLGWRIPRRRSWRVALTGEALRLGMPGGATMADAARPILLRRHASVPFTISASVLAVRKLSHMATQGLFLLMGAALGASAFQAWARHFGSASALLLPATWIAGVGLTLLAVLLGLALFKGSLATRTERLLSKITGGRLAAFVERQRASYAALDERLRQLLGGHPIALVRSGANALLAWLVEAAETWIILSVLGVPAGWREALAIEALASALRVLAFAVPGGLGIQDLGYLEMVRGIAGDGAAAGFVVLKRGRDLVWVSAGLLLPFLVARLRRPKVTRTSGESSARTGTTPRPKRRVLFVGGSLNQTTQLHQVAQAMPDAAFDKWFSPAFGGPWMERFRRLGLVENTVLGKRWSAISFQYIQDHRLQFDYGGRRGPYDLVVLSQDLVIPNNLGGARVLLVQEGMTDPENWAFHAVRHLPFLPRWIASTAAAGLSDRYDRFCVASEGYRDLFIHKGARPEKLVITGIPNFDDCIRYGRNDFPYRDYVLVCTSDSRETYKRHDRDAFIRRAQAIAAGRPLIFKLHPNESWGRAVREIGALAPEARVFTSGCAEEMVANCCALIVEYSTLAFVGLALGKEVHAWEDQAVLRRLLPLQNGDAARRIARVACELSGVVSQQAQAGDALPAPQEQVA